MGQSHSECVPEPSIDNVAVEQDAGVLNHGHSCSDAAAADSSPSHAFLAGGGEMGELIRATDWSKTPIGAPDTWSSTLRTLVGFLLANRFPLLLWWGPQYIQIYNDAYRPILGTKHPRSLGQPTRECWSEIWDIIGPLIDTPFHGGPATWMEDLALELNRHGYWEETHFTIAYSPVPDETAPRGIGGVIATVHEITAKVVGERRVAILRDLGASAPDAVTAEDACAIAAQTLARHTLDVPFILLYLIEGNRRHARLVGAAGLEPGGALSPATIDLAGDGASPWPVAAAMAAEELQVVEDLAEELSRIRLGPWANSPQTAVVVPIRSTTTHEPAGVMIAGVSARLKLDELYRSFFELVATQISTAVAKARAYEVERQRAEALAELDRAKTLFFSNVSHEFRTPLTLMLGPLEELRASISLMHPEVLEQIESAHRNALRLLKLVNALLEFSRIESGRVQATYEAVDLATFTAELVSTFRSACEKAGLNLKVDCSSITEPMFVDRDMWEKMVLNLVSNAFKFTFEGEIRVSLSRGTDGGVELQVADTGTGIPEDEMPRLFERFHRIHGAPGRSVEGTGIGLAMVHELVKLHGGTVRATSVYGQGTAFHVHLPLRPAPAGAQAPGSARPAALSAQFAQEASLWLANDAVASVSAEETVAHPLPVESSAAIRRAASQQRPHVLIADDNADLRAYLSRLLGPTCRVTAVADGEQALQQARRLRPDLVVADIMMPNLDGISLVKALRADPDIAGVPVILLSARAGEEAKIEGLDTGADDYLVKPFSPGELLARVRSQLTLSQAREQLARERETSQERIRIAEQFAELQKQDFNALLMQAPNPFMVLRGPEYRVELVNPVACRIWDRNAEDVVDRSLFDVLPELRGQGFKKLLDDVMASGIPHEGREVPVRLSRRDSLDTLYFNFLYAPLRDLSGKIDGVLVVAFDVTEEVAARTEIERLKGAAESANRMKDEFLAMLGHELRNPLSPIKTALDVMRLRGVQSPEQAVIERQVVHLTRLVDDLLDVSRIARGKIDLRKEPIEIAEAALRAIEMASPILEQRNHRLEFHIARNGLQVEADPERFAQILSNLLTNAAKYSDAGSRITMVASRQDGRVRVTVKDEGIGIAPEMLDSIFDLFVQEPQSIDRSRGGLGLGLTIVRNLVKLHGGTVTARSAGLGKGSEFILDFPLLDSASRTERVRAPVRPVPSAVAAKRVLVVDDNNDAAATLKLGLEAIGHLVVTAPDGPTALEVARLFQPEVAFLDIGLPAMDGYELARHIRNIPGMPDDLRLIAVTGYGLESDRQRTRAAGFCAHLVKPVSFDRLAALCAGTSPADQEPSKPGPQSANRDRSPA